MKSMLLMFAGLLAAGLAMGQEAAAPPLVKPETLPVSTAPRHVRVTWMEKPATQAVISWSTTLPGETHAVHVDTAPRNGVRKDYAKRVREVHSGEYTRSEDDLAYGEPPLYYHHALLSDLEPSTAYYFAVASDEDTSQEFHFITAPVDDRPIRILFGGDSRIGGSEPYLHEDRRAINRRMALTAEEHEDVIAFAHGGDFFQRAELRYMKPWMTDHELVTTAKGRILPLIPTRGNHDRQIGFEEMFYWPERSHDYYYVTQLGAKTALVTLNTEISLAGAQSAWLAGTLKDLRPANDWVFVQYHKPSYPSVRGWTDGEDRRHFFVPIMERFYVDLVMESHDHAMKRTLPIREGGPHPQGITYIGDGGLGVPLRTPDPTRWYLQSPGLVKSAHHFHLLEFTDGAIRGRAFGMDGAVLDDFSLAPQPAEALAAAE